MRFETCGRSVVAVVVVVVVLEVVGVRWKAARVYEEEDSIVVIAYTRCYKLHTRRRRVDEILLGGIYYALVQVRTEGVIMKIHITLPLLHCKNVI